MAATVTHRGTTFNTTAGNKTVVATPAVGDLIVVIAAATGVNTTAITDTQSGTYVKVDSDRTGWSTTGTLNVWVRTAAIPAASSTTWTATQTSSTGGGLSVMSVSGMTLVGASAVRSSGGQSSGTAATTPAPVLSLTPLSTNPIIMAVANASGTTTTLVPRTGYTENFDNGYATPSAGLEVANRASGETSATLTAGGTSGTAFASIAVELAYDTAPTVALNTLDTSVLTTTTPVLEFTGTDADAEDVRYNIQIDTTSTFGLVDSYSETNNDAPSSFAGVTSVVGESFPGAAKTLGSATFYMSKSGSPTGNLVAKLYTISGTSGSTATPSTLLATSDNLACSTLTTSLALTTFTFSGVNQYAMSAGTNYMIVVDGIGATVNGSNLVSFGRDASSATHSGNYYSDVAGAVAGNALCFYVNAVLTADKVSGTDSGFLNTVSGPDTDPFNSGQKVSYTVQSALADGTYYWRVRGKDPLGTNTYGAWPTTRSFTVSTTKPTVIQRTTGKNTNGAGTTAVAALTYNVTSGNTIIVVVGVADRFNTAVTGVSDTLGSTYTNVYDYNTGNAGFTGHLVYTAPLTSSGANTVTVTTGLFADNIHVYEVYGLDNPSVDVSANNQSTTSPLTATTATTAVANELVIGVATQNLGSAPTWTPDTNFSNTQTTTNNGCMMITSERVVTATGTQAHTVSSSSSAGLILDTVITFKTVSSGTNATVTQVAANATLAAGTQTVVAVSSGSVTQVSANLVGNTGTQVVAASRKVAVAQVAGTLTATGGTQTIATVQNAALSQSTANLVLTGQTQTVAAIIIASASIAQVTANLTLTSGTQVVSGIVVASSSVSQTTGSLSFTTGTQVISATVIASASTAQVAANLVLTGGTQAVSTVNNDTIGQVFTPLAITGGTQTISATSAGSANVAQVTANATLTGGTQTVAAVVISSAAITQTARTLSLTTGTQVVAAVVIAGANVSQLTSSIAFTGGTQVVTATVISGITITQLTANLVLSSGTNTVLASGGGGGTTGEVKVWNGSAFVAKPVKVWNGSTWVVKPLKQYNGSAWVVTNY